MLLPTFPPSARLPQSTAAAGESQASSFSHTSRHVYAADTLSSLQRGSSSKGALSSYALYQAATCFQKVQVQKLQQRQ
jgi:hypothetical protein